MIFCARATRGLGRPSLGLLARLGVPVGGRVKKSRTVEDQSAPIPERGQASLEGSLMRPVQSNLGPSLGKEVERVRKPWLDRRSWSNTECSLKKL